jgi:two-component system, sensor histidine kinase YesM
LLKKFHNKLFVTYFLIIIAAIVLLSSIYFFYLSKILKERCLKSIEQQSKNICIETDSFIRKMDRIAIQLATNNRIRNIIGKSYLNSNISERLLRTNEVEEIILNTISPWFSVRQVNVFDYDTFYGVGVSIPNKDLINGRFNEIDWIKSVINKSGEKQIIGPHSDDWSSSYSRIISLSRSFYTVDGHGIVQVQEEYDKLKSLVNQYYFNEDQEIYIFTDEGNLIYPEISEKIRDNIDLFRSLSAVENTVYLDNEGKKEKLLVSVLISDYSNIRVITAESEEKLLSPVASLKYNTIYIMIILLLVTLLASYLISKKIAHSISLIKNKVNNLSIDNLSINFSAEYNGMDELNQLYQTFSNMCGKLKESINLQIKSREKENAARLAAFQSQINPHFIYNTLSVIGAKGNESNAPLVEEMCCKLSSMLRYITGSTSFVGVLSEEIEYANNYLNLVKSRYEERFEYQIKGNENLNNIKIPKMIVQPIVENCIFHGFGEGVKVLTVAIGIKIIENKWLIEIEDNGRGFSGEALESVYKEINDVVNEAGLVKISNQKVGLVNSYIRLYLFYKGDLIFDIETGENGSKVTIGGIIQCIE